MATMTETAAAPTGSSSSATVAQTPASGARGLDLLTGPEGDVLGIAITAMAQVHAMVEQMISSPKLVALNVEQRYSLAGKVASVPVEHERLIERLLAGVSSAPTEGGALNALYILEICKELVSGFKEKVPEERLTKAAELSAHGKVQAAVLLGQKPEEWEKAKNRSAPTTVVMFPEEEEDKGIIWDAGRAVGDATKLVGGAAFGGVGMVTDAIGVTDGAEDGLAVAAEDAVDIVGDGMNAVVEGVDDGITGTADDFAEKGVAGTLGDGIADSVDIVSDFVGDAVQGIAGGVHAALNFITGEEDGGEPHLATHKVAIVVAELFGEERSLGLRLENRVVTKFTKTEAETLGWRLGDCIVGLGAGPVKSQEELLAAISVAKEALKARGAPMRFIVERLGAKPAGPKVGDTVLVQGNPAKIMTVDPRTSSMTVKLQHNGSVVRIPLKKA